MVEDDMLLLLSKWKGGRLMGRGVVGIPVWVIWRCRWRASLGFDLSPISRSQGVYTVVVPPTSRCQTPFLNRQSSSWEDGNANHFEHSRNKHQDSLCRELDHNMTSNRWNLRYRFQPLSVFRSVYIIEGIHPLVLSSSPDLPRSGNDDPANQTRPITK